LTKRSDEDKLLHGALSWQWHRRKRTSQLGSDAETYLRRKSRQFEKNASVVDLWSELLPADFQKHCTLTKIEAGVITIQVDPGPYLHEMQLLSTELLREIQNQCRSAGIKRIMIRPRK
jgi:hypothetical protein